ncbi:DUF6600 domain-containing protein, partial [Thermodesulfobacteriota bacterium]
VGAGKMLSLGKYWADLSPLGLADAWERWNKDQDRAFEGRRKSIRYLPEELAGYSRDFDNNGDWVDLPSYGYVWRPTAQVGAGWSPYRHGRWVWIGNDYVWITHESWGWAPYHYGRWSFVSRYGWCWVPPARHEVYWGPGYVGWVRTATYVAWVPLAPREVYYGHGYYGSNSVDITHVDVNKVVIKLVYKNVHVNNSVTAVHNDTFIRGRQVDFKVDGNPFLKEKINVGRPRIQPERATRIGSFREIPKAKEPPDKVKVTRVEELQKQRRLVKKRDKSVFLPETAPRAMTVEEKKEPRSRIPRKDKLTAGEGQEIVPQKREDARQAPAERKSLPSERPSSTPPESKRESKQPPQPGAQDKQSTRDQGSSQTNRRSTQPAAAREDARQAPAVTKEGTKDEGATSTPEDKKKVKKEDPSETDVVLPEEYEAVPRERNRRNDSPPHQLRRQNEKDIDFNAYRSVITDGLCNCAGRAARPQFRWSSDRTHSSVGRGAGYRTVLFL